MTKPDRRAHDCNCQDSLNITLGHYLGVTLLIAVASTLYLGVSGRVKDTALLPTLQTFGNVVTLIVGGMLAAWNLTKKEPAKPVDDGKPQDVSVVNPASDPVPVDTKP